MKAFPKLAASARRHSHRIAPFAVGAWACYLAVIWLHRLIDPVTAAVAVALAGLALAACSLALVQHHLDSAAERVRTAAASAEARRVAALAREDTVMLPVLLHSTTVYIPRQDPRDLRMALMFDLEPTGDIQSPC